MARRARILINNQFTTTLKTGTKKRTCKTNSEWNVLVTRSKFKPLVAESYTPKVWVKFDSTDFDGIHIVFGLYNKGTLTPSGSCTFRIYSVSLDDSWQETLLTTVSGTIITGGRFKADVSASSLSPIELDGEQTLMIEIEALRQNTVFKDRFYFNHLGAYEFLTRLKNKVTFLELTKADE